MKNWTLLALIPISLTIASFWLAYSHIDHWGWFLFGAILTAIVITNRTENVECNCNCKNSEDGCGDKCKCK